MQAVLAKRQRPRLSVTEVPATTEQTEAQAPTYSEVDSLAAAVSPGADRPQSPSVRPLTAVSQPPSLPPAVDIDAADGDTASPELPPDPAAALATMLGEGPPAGGARPLSRGAPRSPCGRSAARPFTAGAVAPSRRHLPNPPAEAAAAELHAAQRQAEQHAEVHHPCSETPLGFCSHRPVVLCPCLHPGTTCKSENIL